MKPKHLNSIYITKKYKMSERTNITLDKWVFDILQEMNTKNNRSELIQELIIHSPRFQTHHQKKIKSQSYE